jgi:hypothetical protein
MKIRTHEAANRLGLHPTALLLYLAEAGATLFDDAWPELDEAWVEAITHAHWDRFGTQRANLEGARLQEPNVASDHALGESAGMLLEKLWRKDKWGGARVTIEALVNMLHQPASVLDGALEELQAHKFVVRQADQYSLDPRRKGEIDRIAKSRTGAA